MPCSPPGEARAGSLPALVRWRPCCSRPWPRPSAWRRAPRWPGCSARGGPLRTAGPRISGTPALVWLALVAAATLGTRSHWSRRCARTCPAWRGCGGEGARSVSQVVRTGADVALIALAALAVWQIRAYSAVAWSPRGTLGIDPVLAAAPRSRSRRARLVLLRLLPLAARTAERAAGRQRVPGALAVWQFSRRPLRQAGPALLVVLAVATGTLALSQHQTWVGSAQDQAAFRAGAPVRVDTQLPVSPALGGDRGRARGAGGDAGGADHRRPRRPGPRGGRGSGGTHGTAPAGRGCRTGAGAVRGHLPGRPAWPRASRPPGRFIMTASLGPASLRLGRAPVTVSVQDADGETRTLPAGPLAADGRPHRLDRGPRRGRQSRGPPSRDHGELPAAGQACQARCGAVGRRGHRARRAQRAAPPRHARGHRPGPAGRPPPRHPT